MPTTTLLTSFPLLSTDIGFSTTTVWLWELGNGAEPEGIDAGEAGPIGLCMGSGTLTFPILTFVIY